METIKLFSGTRGHKMLRKSALNFSGTCIIFFLTILAGGCEKDDALVQREYLKDGYIHFTLTSRNNGSKIVIDDTYRLFESYSTSKITTNNTYKDIVITRYSDNLQSYVQLYLIIDPANSRIIPSPYGVTFSIRKIDKNGDLLAYDNSIQVIGSQSPGSVISTSSFDNIMLDTVSKKISGNFYHREYYYPGNGDTLDVNGDFNVQLYEFLN